MADRLKGKIAIVTGAARGQGQVTAELFADEGAIVYACDVDSGDLVHDRVEERLLDVAQASEWEALVQEVIAAHSRIDILVNNAAIVLSVADVATMTMDDLNSVLQVNLIGPTLGTQAVLPSMRGQGAGSIVNIISTLAGHAAPVQAAYQLAKGGLRTLTQHTALTYASEGVRTNAVMPGLIDTRMIADSPPEAVAAAVAHIPLGRLGQPIEVARGTLFLASDEASYVNGSEVIIDGGVSI